MTVPLDVRRPPRQHSAPPPPRGYATTRRFGRRRRPQWLAGFLLILPSLIAIGVFVYGFIG